MTLYEFVSLTFPTPEIRSRGCFQLEVNFNNNKLSCQRPYSASIADDLMINPSLATLQPQITNDNSLIDYNSLID